MKILIKFLTSSEILITLPDESTVNDLKVEVDKKLDISTAKQIFFFKGKRLQDDKTLESYGIATDSTLKLVIKSDVSIDNSTTLNNLTNSKETNSEFKSEDKLTMKNIEGNLPSLNHSNFNTKLLSVLQKHFSPQDSQKVLQQFNKNFEVFMEGLTLKDIEEVARVNITRNQ